MNERDPAAQTPDLTLPDAIEASYKDDLAQCEAVIAARNAEVAALRTLVRGLGADARMFAAATEDALKRLAAIEAALGPAIAALGGATKGEWMDECGALIYRYAVTDDDDGSDNARAIVACVNAVRRIAEMGG